MATFTIDSPLPEYREIEADNFYVKEGYVHFVTEDRNGSQTVVIAIRTDYVETVTRNV